MFFISCLWSHGQTVLDRLKDISKSEQIDWYAANSGGDNDYEDDEDVGSDEEGDDCMDCQQESTHLTFRKFCKRDFGEDAFWSK